MNTTRTGVLINGSGMEGGGQILRVATALSTLFSLPLKIFNIRGGRQNPGLRPQHLTGLQFLKRMTELPVFSGLEKNSMELTYKPSKIISGCHEANCPTAGSVTLILQGVLPCALFADKKSTLILRGGTNVPWSPPVEYANYVFFPLIQKFGATCSLEVHARGYNPKGGGEIVCSVEPSLEFHPINLIELGVIVKIWGEVHVSPAMSPKDIDDLLQPVVRIYKIAFPSIQINWTINRLSESANCGISLFAESSNGCCLGNSQLSQGPCNPCELVSNVATGLLQQINDGVCVDNHAQDQVLLYMALAKGTSRMRTTLLTRHTTTCIAIIQKFIQVEFSIIEEGKTTIIECCGMGFHNRYIETAS